MPELLTKIEGKGNGIKTVLPNISDVARALSRPPTCVLCLAVFHMEFLIILLLALAL